MSVRSAVRAAEGAWTGALTLLLAGCHSYWPMTEELAERIRSEAAQLEPPIDDDRAVRAAAEQVLDGTVPPPSALPLPAEPTVDDYVRLALLRNPRIQARIRDLEALGMRVPQVTSLEDPMLDVMPPVGEMLETAAGGVDAQIGVQQTIPWPGKLAAAGRVAEQVVRVALENLRAERLAVTAQVHAAHADYFRAGVVLRVTRELTALLEQLRDAAEAGQRAGRNALQDVLQLEVELYALANEVLTLEQQAATARARLNLLMDRAMDAPIPEPAPFEPDAAGAELGELIARASEANPELAALRAAVQRDLDRAAWARLQYFPDLSLGALFTFIGGGISPVANGNDSWGLSLGATLPIFWHRIRAGVLERNAETLATALRWRATRNDVLLALQETAVRATTRHRSALLLRDAILPRARQALDAARAGYEAGQVEFTSMVESWRRLLDLTLDYHTTLAGLASDRAELERLVGGTLPRSGA